MNAVTATCSPPTCRTTSPHTFVLVTTRTCSPLAAVAAGAPEELAALPAGRPAGDSRPGVLLPHPAASSAAVRAHSTPPARRTRITTHLVPHERSAHYWYRLRLSL